MTIYCCQFNLNLFVRLVSVNFDHKYLCFYLMINEAEKIHPFPIYYDTQRFEKPLFLSFHSEISLALILTIFFLLILAHIALF